MPWNVCKCRGEKLFLISIDRKRYLAIMISRLEVRGIKSVIFRLPDELHQKLKVKVAEEKTTIQKILEEYIEEYVGESETKTK